MAGKGGRWPWRGKEKEAALAYTYRACSGSSEGGRLRGERGGAAKARAGGRGCVPRSSDFQRIHVVDGVTARLTDRAEDDALQNLIQQYYTSILLTKS